MLGNSCVYAFLFFAQVICLNLWSILWLAWIVLCVLMAAREREIEELNESKQ